MNKVITLELAENLGLVRFSVHYVLLAFLVDFVEEVWHLRNIKFKIVSLTKISVFHVATAKNYLEFTTDLLSVDSIVLHIIGTKKKVIK